MARLDLRRPQNAPGDLFVDSTCIDCDTCRWMAPETFTRADGMSAVTHQPATPSARRRALQALVSCPTASIGTSSKAPDVAAAGTDFPLPIAGEVHHCGYHSESSFGATSYLVRRPDGNLLVDVPRFAAPLVRRLEELGGVAAILLTHRDDVADHVRYADHFGARRIIHARDADGMQQGHVTAPAIETLSGTEPQTLFPGVTAIPTPGHTAGHVCFLVEGQDGPFLFTGDHLAWDPEATRLEAWPEVCWFDWGEQTRSMERLLQHPFEWVLPGHGRRVRQPWPRMRDDLARLVGWMRHQ